MGNQPNQPPITALLTRQLSDWQRLLAELQAKQTPSSQLDYCQAQIDRLTDELDALSD